MLDEEEASKCTCAHDTVEETWDPASRVVKITLPQGKRLQAIHHRVVVPIGSVGTNQGEYVEVCAIL